MIGYDRGKSGGGRLIKSEGGFINASVLHYWGILLAHQHSLSGPHANEESTLANINVIFVAQRGIDVL